MNENNCNDSSKIIAQALDEMKKELGPKFNEEKINLAELSRRTGISRGRLRKLKKNGFVQKPHGSIGKKADKTVLSSFTGIVDNFLRNSVTNSSVIFDRLKDSGYTGGLTQVKVYISQNKNLVPAKRQAISPQGNRGRRYDTGPGETCQMDWGFVDVETYDGKSYKVACFAMICHHCGECYVEFFPNARQENLFIGMIRAFFLMGVPRHILTDNMKSVVISRDPEGHPIWQHDYESFMKTVGFDTRLCKPRHPFTKGKVERLIRFVKDNFLAGRTFNNVTDLNCEALNWCSRQNSRYHAAVDCVPAEVHFRECAMVAHRLEKTPELLYFYYPLRKISFDGFVNYEGRRFGVPYRYTKQLCRICRDGFTLYIYSDDLSEKLAAHNVTWSKRDTFCSDQYVKVQPEELPTAPVTTVIRQLEPRRRLSMFDKFNFSKGGDQDE